MKKKTEINGNKLTKKTLFADLTIIGLAFLSVGLLIYELSADLLAEQLVLIHTIDLAIALIFLSDFTIGMYRAKNKKQHFKKHWTDLIASIPITDGIYRSLRVLRLLRIVRIIRFLARLRRIESAANKIAENSAKYIYVAAITFVFILSGSILFFSAELDINPKVNNFFDAVWWAVVTATTVGYGDIHPLTWEGRVIGMILMFFGVGLLGTTAGLVGSHILKKESE